MCTVQCGDIEAKALGIFSLDTLLPRVSQKEQIATGQEISMKKFQQKIIQLWHVTYSENLLVAKKIPQDPIVWQTPVFGTRGLRRFF